MIDASTRPEKLSNSALLFLVLAPFVVFNYLIFILNTDHASSPLAYGLQLTADFFSILAVSGLWLTILLDLLTPIHQLKDRSARTYFLRHRKPSIDVFIPVLNEPLELVERTMKAALAMEYPHQVFILDDGRSDQVRELAVQHGAGYIRRPQKRNAKSGNINFGLKYSQADFFAILDADFVADVSFLTELLGYMEDERIAFVQSPQHFVNTEHFVAAGTAASQEIFYRYVLPSRNSSESAFCVGTNVIFRRKAIDEVGGIFELDHSEDIWTSLVLHERGWKSLFVNKILAEGQAPDTISSYFKQQKRWAQGGFTIFFQKNPLFIKALSLDQRTQYLYSSSFYFVGFSIFIYLFLPILYLFFNLSPIKVANVADWIIHYLPYFTVFYTLPVFLTGRLSIPTISTSLATFWPYLQAFFDTILERRYEWITTSSRKSRQSHLLNDIWPHLTIISLSVIGSLVAWIGVKDVANTAINSLWSLANAYLLTAFIRGGLKKAEASQEIPSVNPTPALSPLHQTLSITQEAPEITLDHVI